MAAKQLLNKALLLLDKGRIDAGEESLRQAIALSRTTDDVMTLATSLCCLGDLLWQLGRHDEARPLLGEVLGLTTGSDDRLAYERRRANEILQGLEGHS